MEEAGEAKKILGRPVTLPPVIVAVARIPEKADARGEAARLAGLALADANRRLAGTLPRVLAPGASPEAAEALAAALEAQGFVTVVFDPKAVPGDADRVVAARIDVVGGILRATDGPGRVHDCPGGAIALLQWGVRVKSTAQTVKTSERKFAAGKALLSGGLMLTKKVEKTTEVVTETREPFLLVSRNDGEPDLILYERRLDYRFLGAEMQPVSRANLERVLARLRTLAPEAPLDDRVMRPGFVAGLPMTSNEPVDLALFLVTLARARGA
jgi:hypothetical protein